MDKTPEAQLEFPTKFLPLLTFTLYYHLNYAVSKIIWWIIVVAWIIERLSTDVGGRKVLLAVKLTHVV